MSDFNLVSLIPQIAFAAAPIFVALVGWISAHVAAYIKSKTKNELLAGALLRVNDAVWTAVREVEQTIVEQTKIAAADGKLTDEEKAAIKKAAIDKAKEYLTSVGLEQLKAVFGISDQSKVDALIAGKIEAAVSDMRNDSTSPKA